MLRDHTIHLHDDQLIISILESREAKRNWKGGQVKFIFVSCHE